MIATTASTRVLTRTFRVLVVLEMLAFLCFALLHLGVRIPLGFAVLQELQRPYAVIVEGVAAIVLALAATAVFTRRTWAWAAATVAHAVALAGVLWGMIAIAAGRGPHTQLNDTFHRVMAVVLAAGLILLLTRRGRAAVDSASTPPVPAGRPGR
jgi:membrane-anchored protein YejM (alkaline phosphatase superfamily)